MAFNEGKIHVGAARIWFGVTAPTTGTPPTYITHTAGVPGSGTEAGLTEGDCMFSYEATKKKIEVEQVAAPVGVFLDTENAMLEFTCKEQTYNTLKQAFDNCGTESVTDGDAFWFGGGTGVINPRTQCIFFSSIQRNAPTKFIVGALYKCASMEGFKLPLARSKEAVYKVVLHSLADLTRNAGDYMGYYRFEK